MILDSGETLFVWLGRESNRQEREAVLTTAKDYLLSDPSGRDVDIPVILVKQGHEPPHFTGYFGAWDINLWPVNRHTFYQGTMFEIDSKMSHSNKIYVPRVAIFAAQMAFGASCYNSF